MTLRRRPHPLRLALALALGATAVTQAAAQVPKKPIKQPDAPAASSSSAAAVVQQADDPTRFILVEAYRNGDAPAQHKATAHYAAWRDAVAPMMAAPRESVKFQSVHLPG